MTASITSEHIAGLESHPRPHKASPEANPRLAWRGCTGSRRTPAKLFPRKFVATIGCMPVFTRAGC